jgi:hypothetical protein
MLILLTLAGKSMNIISGAYGKMLMLRGANERKVQPVRALLSCRVSSFADAAVGA